MRNDEKNGMPSPVMSDTRMDDFWNNLDANLLATPSQAAAEPKDLSVGFGDAVKAVGAGALDLVGGIGEVARQASAFGKKNGDGNPELSYADQASARMAKRLSPVLDVIAGVGNKAHETSAALVDSMSDDAKEALSRSIISENERGGLTLGDGAGDIDVWALKFANGLGSMLPTLASGGITGAAAKMTLGRAVTTSMLKRGASKEIAEAVAAKAVEKLAAGAAGTTAITGSVGSAGLNAKETINAMSFDELRDSSSFREAFLRIDGDQQYQGLSDFEKLSMARDEVANLASAATMGDVKTWGAAAAGSLLGDTMLFKMLAGKGAKGFIAGAAKGAAGEGIGEMLEEGTQQYAVNQAVNNTTGIESDLWKGVLSSALEGGLIGAGTGGALGAVGGTRASLAERKAKSAEKQQNEDTAKEQAQSQDQDVPSPTSQTAQAEEQAKVVEGAQPAIDTFAETVKPAPEVNAAETQVQAIDNSVTGTSGFDEFADIPTFVRNAADREQFPNTDAQVQAFRDQFDPEREPAKPRGTLDKSELRQPADDSEMGVSSGQFDAFRDVPASRIRGVPNENSAVQQVLAGKREVNSPEGWHPNVRKALAGEYGAQVRDMIAAQIKAGDQGATQAELDARKPFDNKVDRELNQVAVYKPVEGEVIPAEADKPSGNQAGLPRGDLNADYTEIIPETHRIGKSDVIYANGVVSQSADGNSAYVPPVLARNQPDTSMDIQSVRDPRSEVAKAIKRAGTDTDSVFGPLKTLRITRRGKPFSSQKEAQLASRKGIETPVELNGGGYGVASIAEVEQAKAAMPNKETTANAVPENGRPSPNEPIESSQPQLTPANDAGVSVSGRAAAYSRNGTDGAGSQTKGMSKKEVELIAKGFVREYKGAANLLVKVVQTQEEANKLTLGGLPDGYKVHAFYQGNGIGRVVLVADNLTSAKHTLEKLRHEILVHHGFQAVIGDAEYDRILQVLWEARQSPALKPLWEQIQEVERDTPLEGQLEELLAYVAEQPRGPIRKLCDRIVGMIAYALRKVGFINRVTKAELRNIVEAIGDRMKAVAIYADSETGAAVSDKGASGGHVLKGSMAKFSRKKSGVLEGSDSKEIRNVFADGVNSLINLLKQKRPLMLGALSDLQIDQVYRDITGGAISRYQKLRTQMEADRNDILLDAETRIDPLWDALSKEQKSTLSNVMYDATMYKLHPDIPLSDNSLYQETKDRLDKARKPETRAKYAEELRVISDNYKALSERYKLMPLKSRELYQTMKGVYDKQWSDLRDAIDARLADLMGDKSREFSERMRVEMERALQHGPYFPLTRFGDYVVKATKGDEYIREHFERRKDAEKAVKQYQRDGYNARLTVKEDGSGGSANANKLGTEIMEMLDKASKTDGALLNISELKDDIWQSMLKMLPDASYAKHTIHRRRVKGASRDAHRAYLNSVYHYARHISKIKYGHKMAAELEKFNEQIQAGIRGEESVIAPDNLEIAQQVLNEMNKRHELNMNPKGKSWAGMAGTIGFLYYIGPSVASAIINMTQNFTVMLPQLGAKYGFANASSALAKAMSDYIRHGKFKSGTTEAWQSLTRATTGVSVNEKALLNTLYKAGVLDLTQAHSIAAKADTDQQDIKPHGKLVRTGMRWAGALFHNAEVLNREVAALAAYRLLKKAEPNLSHVQYADRVAEMVYDGHGNYAASNRPRYMRSDIVKVLSQFKIYSQMMTYVIYSNAIKAAKGDKVALKTLGGVLGAHWVMAGVMGLPYPITAVVYALSAAFDDDDDRSGEASFRLGLTEALGKTGADLLAKGPMNLVTDLSIASRTGINDLWWREPNKDVTGDDLSWHYVQQILGPVAGIGINLVRGTGKIGSGDVQRGIEMALPVSIRNVSKAYRQAIEGEQTSKGDIILDDISAWNIAMQALGFGSAQMANIYDARGYIKGKEERISKLRSKLLTRYYLAKKDGNSEEVEAVLNDIRAFNATHHPTERITGKSLALSLKSKARSYAQTQQGVYLKKSRAYLRSEGTFAQTEK